MSLRGLTFFITFLSLALGLNAAQTPSLSEMKARLATHTTADDSIKELYNIFDLTPESEQSKVLEMLLKVADRSRNYDVINDAIRGLAYFNSTHSVAYYDSLLKLIAKYPITDDRLETEMYIKLSMMKYLARYGTHAETNPRLTEALRQAQNSTDSSIYEELEAVATICILQSNSLGFNFKLKYIADAMRLLDAMPSKNDALKHLFYQQASIITDNLNMPEEAVKSSRLYISVLDSIEAHNIASGRPYSNFDNLKFFVLVRRLRFAEHLTEGEIDSIYNTASQIARTNYDVYSNEANIKMMNGYYLFAKKKYAEALPLLTTAYDKINDRFHKRRLLSMIRISAQETHDDAALNLANHNYIAFLEEAIDSINYLELADLRTNYELNNIRLQNLQLESDKNMASAVARRNILIIICIAFLILIGLIVVLMRMVKRVRRQSEILAESNKELRTERKKLISTREELTEANRKTMEAQNLKLQFIDNITHELSTPLEAILEYAQLLVDCTDSSRRQYVQKYVDIISVNGDMLKQLVNDMLDIRTLENSKYAISIAPTSVNKICSLAVGTVKPYLKEGVTIKYLNADEADVTILTDVKRVEQVLLNLLRNSTKFTYTGSITLERHINQEDKTISFIVRDTGIGIPEGKEQIIFERFEKLDPHSQGSGLGLAICAMIAKLLRGTIYADTDVDSGARIVFTIPM